MPVYDFRCNQCHQRFEVFLTYAQYGTTPIHCPVCDSSDVQRLIQRVRIARSASTDLDDLSDDAAMEALAQDPRKFGSLMRRISRETGEEMEPEFDQMVDRLEKGDSFEEIEASMPELSNDEGL
ncbi:MAG: zinc ribbon domain-containing protein [Anaerolineaceae bacterium]